MNSLATRASWWMTAVCYVWVWGVLSVAWPSRPWLVFALALACGLSVWVTTRWALTGVLLVAAVLVLMSLLGVVPEDGTISGIGLSVPALVGPMFVAVTTVGYRAPVAWSFWAVPLLIAVAAVSGDWQPSSTISGFILLLLPWWFGVQVRIRDRLRKRASEMAARLALVDPSARALRAAEAEREEVAAAAFDAIGERLAKMTEAANAGREGLQVHCLDEIHREGQQATRSLRALLEVLRDDPAVLDPAMQVSEYAEESREQSKRWYDGRAGQVLQALWPVVLLLVVVFAAPRWIALSEGAPPPEPATGGFLALVILPVVLALALRARFPVVALLVAAGAVLTAALTDWLVEGGGPVWVIVVGAVFSFNAGRVGDRATLLAWMGFNVVIWASIFGYVGAFLWPQIAMHVLPYGAAAVWSGHHAAEIEFQSQARRRQVEIEAAEQAAVARERLRLARDLHDAASHAVGTMMMQANAARVLRERDPDAARAALDAVAAIGRESATELQGVASGAPLLTPAGGERAAGSGSEVDIAGALAPLVAGAERAGARVSTTLDLRSDAAPHDVTLLIRVVREGMANAVRHSPGSHIALEVSVLPTRVEVSVGNSAPCPERGQDVHVSATGLGLGLRGLQELLAERGGALVTDQSDGQFVLRASFPAAVAARPPVVSP